MLTYLNCEAIGVLGAFCACDYSVLFQVQCVIFRISNSTIFSFLLEVEIDINENFISIYNSGNGMPIGIHKEEDVYIPTMIFGHLPTSSNYNDSKKKSIWHFNIPSRLDEKLSNNKELISNIIIL
jgi:hypothetical protein